MDSSESIKDLDGPPDAMTMSVDEMHDYHQRCQKIDLIRRLDDLRDRYPDLWIPAVSLETGLDELKAILEISKREAEQEELSTSFRELLLMIYLALRSGQ